VAGSVETPPGFTVNWIGADQELGVARGFTLYVQYVRMYRFEKPGS
jgi:hypothetical protein